jgi:hypothetical protein
MNLDSQLCSEKQAKKLMDLGISQTALFSVNVYENHIDFVLSENNDNPAGVIGEHTHSKPIPTFKKFGAFTGTYSAFTVAELGAMLPNCTFKLKDSECMIKYLPSGEFYYADASTVNTATSLIMTSEPTEAIARAEMLIYMLQNGIVTADECNDRLIAS